MHDSYSSMFCGVQSSLEGISEQLRIPGSKALGPISSAVRKSKSVLNNDKAKIIADFAPQNKVRRACLLTQACLWVMSGA